MGKEELDLFIAELPQFGAENKVDAHMFSISARTTLVYALMPSYAAVLTQDTLPSTPGLC